MCTGSQYSSGIHKLWQEYEEDQKWEEEELEFEHEELECEHEELTRELPPSTPTATPFPPPHTYKTTIGHQLTPAPYVITQSRPPPWPNKKRNRNQQWSNNFRDTPARTTTKWRPPPWPNKHPNTHPILSITNSRPTPWPNCHHCHHYHCRNTKYPVTQTPHTHPPPWPILSPDPPQNHWNARHQLGGRSRTLSIT